MCSIAMSGILLITYVNLYDIYSWKCLSSCLPLEQQRNATVIVVCTFNYWYESDSCRYSSMLA